MWKPDMFLQLDTRCHTDSSPGYRFLGDALVSVLNLLGSVQPDPGRARCVFSALDCWQDQEQHEYNLVQLLPGVGIYHKLSHSFVLCFSELL